MRKLIISEKYNAAQRISVILSGGTAKRTFINKVPVFSFHKNGDFCSIVGLRGHVLDIDYPDELNSWDKVELQRLVWAKPIKKYSALSLFSALEKLATENQQVIIATDYDREGELIGVEALGIIMHKNTKLVAHRAKFSALTKSEVEQAFAKLSEVDFNLAKAAESRQLIDLAWGAVITRFLSLSSGQVGRDFLSAGRVQSPTLALIVDREREIESFVPEPYWKIVAQVEKEGAKFEAEHVHGIFKKEQKRDAERIFNLVKSARSGTVTDIKSETRYERPPPPFNTTMFLTDAIRLGHSAQSAMKLAEDLYTDGWISYPRTDNTVYPPSLNLRAILGKLKDSEFAKDATEVLSQESIKPTAW